MPPTDDNSDVTEVDLSILDDIAAAATELEEAKAKRDRLIAEASAAGISRRVVARAAKISHGRVHQIINGE